MLAAAASSARGGRSSAATTRSFDRNASSNAPISPRIRHTQSVSILRACAGRSCRARAAAVVASRAARVCATPIEDMPRLRTALGGRATLLVKRDDAIAFAFGGNKVRKLQLVAAD